MYRLFIANKIYSSWSLRPWVLMRELAIPFEEVLTPFPEGSSTAVFKRFSPSAKVPCLHDGAAVVWDSLAIAEYLAERHPGVWPQDGGARAWARSAAAEMHSGFGNLRQHCPMHVAVRVRLHQLTPAVQGDLDRLAELWAEGLKRFGGPFLAGAAFTAVDAYFAPVALRVQTYQLPLPEPAQTYVQRLLSVPAVREWQAQALQEPDREPGHEADVQATGQVVADLRQAHPHT